MFFFRHAYRALPVFGLCLLIFWSQIQPVSSEETKPRAVLMVLISESTPELSEQILLQNLREELSLTYDFSAQGSFEQLLQKKVLSSGELNCGQLKCILEVHQGFPKTSLFLFKSRPNEESLTMVMIGENRKWRVKHEVCSECGFTREEMITNLALSMQGYAGPPMSVGRSQYQHVPKPESIKFPEYVSRATPHQKTEAEKKYFEPVLQEKEETKVKKVKPPLEQFKFKLAVIQYNQLIGNRIKKDLMFFRHKNRQQSKKNLKARLRLQIDQSGRVIDRRLLKPSGSNLFDKIVLETVDLLKLPPPMELLIREPPYVVTILIQP